ncbi:hypothetical protein [Streptomyces boncukensis]|uniref:Uncharacterized protein n=1 Tax=Streptomyces boncukensis TaxID=2711219 RepID=A0A6G4X1J4_9ACTN|nr:hypothetical protein [Streptomyces boncukensis]NGO70531.1 hypothetical protein [Streptomyces boncukensis]
MSTSVWWIEVLSVTAERWHTGPFIPPGPPADVAHAVRAHLHERRLDGAWPEEIRQMLLAVVEVYALPLGTNADSLPSQSERPQDAQLVWRSDLTHEADPTDHASPPAAPLVVNGHSRPKPHTGNP